MKKVTLSRLFYRIGISALCFFAYGLITTGPNNLFHPVLALAADTGTDTVSLPAAPRMSITETGEAAETGCYASAFSLTLSADTGCKIYYTLDGSDPTNPQNSKRLEYTSALTITDRKDAENYVTAVDPAEFDNAYSRWDRTNKVIGDKYAAPDKENVDKATVVRAAAYDEASAAYSFITTNTYFVGDIKEHIAGIADSAKAAGIPLSIISVSTDYENLFDAEKGIYVKGNIFQAAAEAYGLSSSIVNVTRNLAANYTQKGKDWERPAHIDYIESDGSETKVKLQQDCGLRIQGNYSRSDLQKSFRFYARKEYGNGEKNFNYDFFHGAAKDEKGEPIAKYKKLVVRNGGNDAFLAKYRNTYWQTLFAELSCDVLASRACIVYLDGEYWGLYVLQEDLGDDYIEKHHGIDKTDYGIVTYKGDHEANPDIGYEIDDGEDLLPAGENQTYFMKDLINFFDTHISCVAKEDYEALAKLVDPDTCMDYFASEIWINNKWDWPGKNWYMWRTTKTPENADSANPYGDGRWRFALCDMDFGGWSGASEANDNTLNKEKDLLDLNYSDDKSHAGVIIIRTFAYFMSNSDFRAKFINRLDEIVAKTASPATASALADKFADTYDPLYEQFYNRYMSKSYNGRTNDISRQVGTAKSVRSTLTSFAKARINILDTLKETINEKAKTYTSDSSNSSNEENETDNKNESDNKVTPLKLSLSVKSSRKKIVILSEKKAKIVIKFSKKVSYKSGKKIKKIKKLTIKASKNKTGKITLTFQKKLPKKLKITVKETKGKQAKTMKKNY